MEILKRSYARGEMDKEEFSEALDLAARAKNSVESLLTRV